MLVSDVIASSRTKLNDPSVTGRWSTTALIGYYNEAQQILIRDVEFPESRLSSQIVSNQQEYQLPAVVAIYRVYLNGQLLVPTTIQTLEGHQIQEYDQGFGAMPGVQVAGSGGPSGTLGTYTPAWNIQAPTPYPVANSWGSPSPDAQPWSQGQRPRYYLRGGSIGLVPAPAGTATLVIDCLLVPNPAVNLVDASIFPYNFLTALSWKIVELAKFSDDDERAADQRNYAGGQYEREMRKLRSNRKRYDGDQPRGPKLLTYRTSYSKGNNRFGTGWNDC